METSIDSSVAFTHGGIFHADDVFSAALLRILMPSIQIERGFCVPEGFDGIVFDIGGGDFDHHQRDSRVRENGVPYASFGLLWERFGSSVLQPEEFARFDEEFVQPIDLSDNTGKKHAICQLVSDFNPSDATDLDEFDHAFEDAVAWAIGILKRRFNSIQMERKDYNYICLRMDVCDGRVLVLDRQAKWQAAVVGSGYIYVVFPSLRGGYNVQAVPKGDGDGIMVVPFPIAWRGKAGSDLQAATGISGITYCHHSGFLCAADSLDCAVSIANLSLSQGRR